MSTLSTLLLGCIAMLTAALPADKKELKLSYPESGYTIVLPADEFGELQEEWRGQDYYYMTETERGIICSVLFYKLNEEELKGLAGMRGHVPGSPEISPIYPLLYFSTNAKLGSLETMKEEWGDPASDVMYRQAHLETVQGTALNQKNMYAYAMFGSDLFVAVHLSKVFCTPEDSTAMRAFVESIRKKE